jgi:hypothetical protein
MHTFHGKLGAAISTVGAVTLALLCHGASARTTAQRSPSATSAAWPICQ